MKFLKTLQINSLLTAILYIALGVLFILLPDLVLRSIAIITVAVLAIAGVLYIIDYFRKWKIEYRSNGLAIGILLIFGALFLLLQNQVVAAIIPLLLGFAIVVSGTIKLQNAIVFNRVGDRLWIPTIVLAAICLVLGVLVMANPFFTLRVLIIFIGASLLFSGITDLVIIVLISRRAKELRQGPGGDTSPKAPREPEPHDATQPQ